MIFVNIKRKVMKVYVVEIVGIYDNDYTSGSLEVYKTKASAKKKAKEISQGKDFNGGDERVQITEHVLKD